MIDRKNTIENLEQNIRWIEDYPQHQFPGYGNVTMAMRDAVELLKEQEPIKIKRPECLDEIYDYIAYCPKCHRVMCGNEKMRYCPGCGKKVKCDEL